MSQETQSIVIRLYELQKQGSDVSRKQWVDLAKQAIERLVELERNCR
jgi:hypothetical protein